jgi:hypothetical protein
MGALLETHVQFGDGEPFSAWRKAPEPWVVAITCSRGFCPSLSKWFTDLWT